MVEHPSPGVLVLDDCHVIENEAVHQALSSWLEYLPPGLHLVITSRGNPPLTTHRRRARGMMAEIGFRELRFSQDEARAFLQHTMGLGLDEDAVHSLAERLEGWPAGLQLAALSRPQESAAGEGLAGYPSPLKLLEEYLLPEVFEHEPADVQEFLLATALLEEMTAPLCAAVTGAEPGGGIARPSGSQGILPGMAGR
jgi:LuxR family maltose regulon positive regulatory protein